MDVDVIMKVTGVEIGICKGYSLFLGGAIAFISFIRVASPDVLLLWYQSENMSTEICIESHKTLNYSVIWDI